jgi:hypothetical protein
MTHFEDGERPYRHDSDPPTLAVQAESGAHSSKRPCPVVVPRRRR